MTAEADKAPYGSAPKTQCKKWEKKLSRTNISRHTEIRKGIKLSGTRSDIQKKVVGEGSPQAGRFQRNHRATKVFTNGYAKLKKCQHVLSRHQKASQIIRLRYSVSTHLYSSSCLPRWAVKR
ncbi:hypothetical protein Pcac1_g32 [Phytophthora cactorum]|nr:hypothetical protein Pcac1_g32 [Phytophthora cactorum]